MKNYKNKVYGYIRVSSIDQNEDRQIHAMCEAGIPQANIYTDKQSGKDFNRTEYQRMVAQLQAGDLVYFTSIDRMGRNYEDILNEWRRLTNEIGVDIVVLDMEMLDTRTRKNGDLTGKVIADVVLNLLSYVAQKERESIRQRQAEGIKSAKKRGVKFGRPEKQAPDDFPELVRKWERKQLHLSEILDLCDIKPTTFYKLLREYRIRQGKIA